MIGISDDKFKACFQIALFSELFQFCDCWQFGAGFFISAFVDWGALQIFQTMKEEKEPKDDKLYSDRNSSDNSRGIRASIFSVFGCSRYSIKRSEVIIFSKLFLVLRLREHKHKNNLIKLNCMAVLDSQGKHISNNQLNVLAKIHPWLKLGSQW